MLVLPDASASVTKSVYEQYLLAYDSEKFPQALNLINSCLAQNPDDPGALSLRAHFFERNGNLDKALSDYSKVIALAPKDDDGYRYRAEIYMKKKDYRRAIADLNKALQLGSEDRAAIEKSLERAKRLLK